MTYINILLIAIILCFIIDISGVMGYIKHFITKQITKHTNIPISDPNSIEIKPFDCPLCLTFWLSIIYILIINQFTLLNLTYICVIAMLTPQITEALLSLKDFIIMIQTKIANWLQKQIK